MHGHTTIKICSFLCVCREKNWTCRSQYCGCGCVCEWVNECVIDSKFSAGHIFPKMRNVHFHDDYVCQQMEFSCMLQRNKAVWFCLIMYIVNFSLCLRETSSCYRAVAFRFLMSVEALWPNRNFFFRAPVKQNRTWFQTFALFWMLYGFFWVIPPKSEFYIPTFRNTLFHLHRRVGMQILHTYPPMKMEQTECFEMSAYKIQTLGIHPEETIQQNRTFFF